MRRCPSSRLPTTPVVVVAMLVLTSCGSSRRDPPPAANARDLSESAAMKEAASDIQDGRAKIYVTGTIGPYEPGVAAEDRGVVASLPRSGELPTGCTDLRVMQAVVYAEAYNRAVIAAYKGK